MSLSYDEKTFSSSRPRVLETRIYCDRWCMKCVDGNISMAIGLVEDAARDVTIVRVHSS